MTDPNLGRRAFLRAAAAATAAMTTTSRASDPGARAPVLFVSHGAPTLALDRVRGADFRRLGASLGRPSAVLVVSAHWEQAPPSLGTTSARELLYDFGGFPDELRRIRYPAPPAAALAEDLVRRLPELARVETRGHDHGVWVPLLHMFPAADVPVLQLSLPSRWDPARTLALGRALAPLRNEGVVVLGSGGMVHNLGALDWRDRSPPPQWALDFEGHVRAALETGDADSVVEFRDRAPAARLAHPTDEHFLPLLVAMGAGGDDAGPVR